MTTRADPDGELGVVIGRPIPAITTDEALGHVFGHVAANGVSARDVQAAEDSGRAARLGHRPAAGPAYGVVGRFAGPGPPFAGPGHVPVSAHDRGVHPAGPGQVLFDIGLCHRRGEHPLPDAIEAHIRSRL